MAQNSSVPTPTTEPATSFPSMPAPTPVKIQPVLPAPGQPLPVPPPPAPKPVKQKPAAIQSASMPALPAYDPYAEGDHGDELGSTYIPVDSPVYAMVLRLYSMGYLDTGFINMRPWTRRSLLHRLDAASAQIMGDNNEEAVALLASLQSYISEETPGAGLARGRVYGLDTVYSRFMEIYGQPLRDSFHLGQTLSNDYGRPYEKGFNNITGFSSVNEAGRFSLYVRGEYQHSPAAAGYSQALSAQLSNAENIPYSGYNLNQATLPTGPIAQTDTFALQEATLSLHVLGHEISGGKSDAWLSPDFGGAMGWSNNAQDIYSFRINRVEPLHIPLLSRAIGPIQYDFFVGSLKGHTDPNDPWIHSETIAVAPTSNVRISFQRAVIWGGAGHEPVTLHTFFQSFFSFSDTNGATKGSAKDPGARFSSFNFSYRLPFLRKYVTLYTDSTTHDDVTPISAPRRAAYRPGVYLSHVPGVPKLDLRVEGSNTDISTTASIGGSFMYVEVIQKQGYTNKGFLLGDSIGREGKGGQAWATYHLSPNEWIQLEYLHKKTSKDFIPGGTTQNQFKLDVVKRLRRDLELDGWAQYEGWKAPIYSPSTRLVKDTTVALQFTWFPGLRAIPDDSTAPVLRMR
jgi:hypothetical protein